MSTDTIDNEEYGALYASWAEHKDLKTAANEAGVGVSTARRYIYGPGSPTFKPIKPTIDAIEREVSEHMQEDYRLYLKNTRTVSMRATTVASKALMKLEYQPRGDVQPDGTIKVDIREFRDVINTIKTAHTLASEVQQTIEHPSPFMQAQNARAENNVTVNVHTGAVSERPSPSEVDGEVRSFMAKNAQVFNALLGRPEEVQIADAIARSRVRKEDLLTMRKRKKKKGKNQ